jgi:hypothetical protein
MSFLIPALVTIPLALLVVDLLRLRGREAPTPQTPRKTPARRRRERAEPFEAYSGPIRMRAEVPQHLSTQGDDHVRRLHDAVRRSHAPSSGPVDSADSA